MREIYLTQPGFTFSACRPFTKNKETIQKFKETGNMKQETWLMEILKV